MRRAVREEAVKEEQAARLERGGDGLGPHHLVVADLPVAALEVDLRALAVPAREELHAAVLDRGLVEVVEGGVEPYRRALGAFGHFGVDLQVQRVRL